MQLFLIFNQECRPLQWVSGGRGGVSQHALGRRGYVSQHALALRVCIPACTGQGGVCLGSVCPGVVSAWGRGVCPGRCVCSGGCLPRSGLPEGSLPTGCVSKHALGRGGCVSKHALGRGCVSPAGCLPGGVLSARHPPSPTVDRMTDAREKITFPQLRCGR